MFRRIAVASILGSAMTAWYVAGAFATAGSGFTSVDMSKGRFEALAVNANAEDPHQMRLETNGSADVYVVENTVTPGGYSGWHTHPGPSLVTVKSGTASFYDGDDRTCTPRVYETGSGFIDRGNGHVHLVRNEGDVDLVLTTVQLFPADAEQRRIDVEGLGNCAF
jgi:quercetin dioxygenase-like cupin family protein